ncbi:TonB-dependent receptor domain-containing protein [Hephaestia sp. GCM10023244]|uniref:TonB-dependent receptor domain-containing protein n=1 Tax=unclassified Hephaestia TaxID=2631281 RepID=UPI0020775138|nr:TonB-dependent receptor [Hephaestia sp. MAHUQ-44]MCM8729824.1 TonB-dependent receptor [Hephaestia sp. MAHUQ-44]
MMPALSSAQEAPEAERAGSGDAIVVTGTRLSTSVDKVPYAVLQVSDEELAQSGTDNLADILTDLGPVSVGLNENNSQNFYAAAGSNLVDLRKLGYDRTLVLVNGRRQVPGAIGTNAVDLNAIPAPLIERVEIVTGGTSAVYGADAVSGVINVVLKNDYKGLELRGRGGMTARGDGGSYGLSMLAGTDFDGGRGNITFTALYDDVKGVKATARSYASDNFYAFDNPDIYIGGNSHGAGYPYLTHHTNVSYLGPTQLGIINFAAFGMPGVYSVAPGGQSIRPYDYGVLGIDVFGTQIGGDGGTYQQYDNLSLPVERISMAANLRYEIASGAELFFEGRYTNSATSTRWQPIADWEYGYVPISVDNPFVPAGFGAMVQATYGLPAFPFGRIYEDFGRRGADNERISQQYTGGIRGETLGLKYEVFAGYGRNTLASHLVGGRDQDRFLESIDVVLMNGQPACASADARARGCQPLNVFNPAATPAGIAYSLVDDNYAARQTLAMAGANIAGDLFTLPAGPVSAVLGVEARRNAINIMPSHATRGCRIQMLCQDPAKGSVSVREAFGELRVPILANMTAIDELSFQGAARLSDYDTTGTDWTWNLGGTYAPIPDVRFRVMRSRAVRSPSPDALFSSQSQSFLFLKDPCSAPNLNQGTSSRAGNCAALGIPASFTANSSSKPVYFGGNPNLDVEKGDTWTAGMTVTPRVIPGLRIAIDYYDIRLTGAIAPLDAQTILNTCVDNPVNPSGSPACSAITRGADNNISAVRSGFLNVGLLKTSGIDFNIDYAFRLSALSAPLPGRINLNVGGTWVDKLRYFADAAAPGTERKLEGFRPGQPGGLGGTPEWEMTGSATYSTERLAVTWHARYISSVSLAASELVASPLPDFMYDLPYTGSKMFHDLSIAYDVTQHANLRFNVNNIFDSKPPRRNLVSQGRDGGALYPNLGTTFSAVLTYTF